MTEDSGSFCPPVTEQTGRLKKRGRNEEGGFFTRISMLYSIEIAGKASYKNSGVWQFTQNPEPRDSQIIFMGTKQPENPGRSSCHPYSFAAPGLLRKMMLIRSLFSRL